MNGAGVDRRPSRRSVTRGAAWTIPVVAVAVAAPAHAVSAQCGSGCPSMAFGGAVSANGWSLTTTGTYEQGANQRVGWRSSYTPFAGTPVVGDVCTGVVGGTGGGTLTGSTAGDGIIIAEADPTAATPNPTLTYSKYICLTGGVTYTFNFDWNVYGVNRREARLQARVRSETGVVTNIGSVVIATARTVNTRGTRTGSFTMPAGPSQWYTFEYFWTFNTAVPSGYTAQCDRYANDIAVNAPRVTCSPTP